MRNLLLTFFLIAFTITVNSCKQPVKNDKIKNGIEVYENGLNVEQAFLTNGDSTEIGDDNKVHVGERVCLRMIIKGWKEDKGKVFMDASQTVTTSAGDTLTSSPSLFGITLIYGTVPEGADHVLLYQTIGRLNKPVDYILISFKVWDKSTNKSVHGSYKVYM
jgi:hypothetical protein